MGGMSSQVIWKQVWAAAAEAFLVDALGAMDTLRLVSWRRRIGTPERRLLAVFETIKHLTFHPQAENWFLDFAALGFPDR